MLVALTLFLCVGLSLQQCTTDPDLLPACNPGQTPTTVNGCPSCYVQNEIAKGCTLTQLQACYANQGNLPACAAGVAPTRDANTCCLSCKYTTPPCTRQQLEAAVTKYPTLPLCTGGAQSVFSTATCSRNCRRPPAAGEMLVNGTCSASANYQCFSSTDTCRFGEIPVRNDPNLCCSHCRRPETQCQRETIVYCFQNIPTCSAGELPTYVAGECCPTCKLGPFTCPAACPTGQVCYPNHKDANGNIVPACVATKVLNFKTATNAGSFDPAVTGNDIKIYFREFVMRLCERNTGIPNNLNAACTTYAESNDDLDAKISTWVVDKLAQVDQSTLTLATDTGLGLGKRQSAYGNILDIIFPAINDDFAPVGFTFVYEPNGVPVPVDTNPKINTNPRVTGASSSLVFSFVLCLLALFAVMY